MKKRTERGLGEWFSVRSEMERKDTKAKRMQSGRRERGTDPRIEVDSEKEM